MSPRVSYFSKGSERIEELFFGTSVQIHPFLVRGPHIGEWVAEHGCYRSTDSTTKCSHQYFGINCIRGLHTYSDIAICTIQAARRLHRAATTAPHALGTQVNRGTAQPLARELYGRHTCAAQPT